MINTNNIVIQYGGVILTCLPFWSAQDLHAPSRQLRSSAGSRILCIPSVNTKSYSERYFCYIAQRCRTPFQKKSATLSHLLPLNQHLKCTFSQHNTDWCVCVCVCINACVCVVWQRWELLCDNGENVISAWLNAASVYFVIVNVVSAFTAPKRKVPTD